MRRCDFQSRLPLLGLLCILQAGKAQTIRIFDTESGLPHNRVNKIYRDSKNFLWICTDDGLSRFDGHQFVNYTTADGLPHRYVNAVLETRTGEYWIATDNGVSHYDPRPFQGRFTNYAPSGTAEARHVNALIEEPDGTLLLGTSVGLYRFRALPRPGTFEHIDFSPEPNARDAVMVNAIAHDNHGSLWLATDHGLYQRGRNATWTHYGIGGGLSAVFVSSFAEERNGRLWVAFTNGIGRIAIDPKPGTPVLDFVQTDQPELGRVRALWFGADGRRWIATNTGLKEWIMDSNRGSRFRDHTIQERFPHEAVLSIGEDHVGSLWIGTRRSGLAHIGASRFQSFGANEGLQLGRDQLLLEVRRGQVHIFDIGGKRNQVYRQEGGGGSLLFCPPCRIRWHSCRTFCRWRLRTTKERGGFRRLPDCLDSRDLTGRTTCVFCPGPQSVGSLKTPRETSGYRTGLAVKSLRSSPVGNGILA